MLTQLQRRIGASSQPPAANDDFEPLTRYDIALRRMEGIYPEIDADSPSYQPDAMHQVYVRMRLFIHLGQPADVAVRLAANEALALL